MPAGDDPRTEWGRTVTVAQRGPRSDDDVARARAGVRHVGVTYGPRTSRRSVGDLWFDFVARYGWRAYALPVLVIITVAALLTTTGVRSHPAAAKGHATHPGQGVRTPPPASDQISLPPDAAQGSKIDNSVLRAAELPQGAPYTKRGKGTFRVLKGTSRVAGHGRLYRYSIDVENGITHVDLRQFQNDVVQVLSDPRSWSGHGVALKRVDSGPIDFHVTLTSVMTVRNLCGYTIPVETSCYIPSGTASSPVNRVVLNDARWARGSAAYVGDLASYRIYMINHEDGHALGHQHAHQCLPGGLAPVMMQQTFGLRSAANRRLCQANPWPYPPGAKGAPGAEQPDTPQNDEYGLGD